MIISHVNYPINIYDHSDLKEEDRKYMLEVYRDSDNTNLNRTYSLIRPYIGFFCKKCFYPIILKANINVELEYLYDDIPTDQKDTSIWVNHHYTVRCPKCGKYSTWDSYLDPAITPVLAKLNHKGYETLFSCQGHPHIREYCRLLPEDNENFEPTFCNMFCSCDAYIAFSKNTKLDMIDIISKYPLIKPWRISKHKNCNKDISLSIRTEDTNHTDLVERMVALYKWVESLPNVRNQ